MYSIHIKIKVTAETNCDWNSIYIDPRESHEHELCVPMLHLNIINKKLKRKEYRKEDKNKKFCVVLCVFVWQILEKMETFVETFEWYLRHM